MDIVFFKKYGTLTACELDMFLLSAMFVLVRTGQSQSLGPVWDWWQYMASDMTCSNTFYYMADWFRVLWLVNSRSVSGRTDLLLSINFKNRNNQQSHIIKILLASFARSAGQVMDPRFFLSCFHGPRASRLGHKRKEKNSVHNLPYGPRTRLIKLLKVFIFHFHQIQVVLFINSSRT